MGSLMADDEAPAGLEAVKAGLCGMCGHKTAHGPWTDAQIADVCMELGVQPGEFSDECDGCFVKTVGGGDVRYAAKLAGRPMQLVGADAFRAMLGLPL